MGPLASFLLPPPSCARVPAVRTLTVPTTSPHPLATPVVYPPAVHTPHVFCPVQDWLPVLQSELNITELIAAAAAAAGASPLPAASPPLPPATADTRGTPPPPGPPPDHLSDAGDLGLLQLALLVAQQPAGARMLMAGHALEGLSSLCRHLLAGGPGGGGLAPFVALDVPGVAQSATQA
eukprot:332377-Chlamydomonas_euryale.AAC.1